MEDKTAKGLNGVIYFNERFPDMINWRKKKYYLELGGSVLISAIEKFEIKKMNTDGAKYICEITINRSYKTILNYATWMRKIEFNSKQKVKFDEIKDYITEFNQDDKRIPCADD